MTNIPGLEFIVFCSLISLHSARSYSIFTEACTFPEEWSGRWFQSGVRNVMINSTSIQYKGHCIQSDGDKFLIEDKEDNCFRCVVIHEKHENVLQYKETYCEWREPLETLCEKITGDAPLFSMFRVEAKPTPCPFKPPFTYTYDRGSGKCRTPVSRADPCTEDSRLLLRYQACPDVHNSESSVEELVCLAWWKDGSMRYLVGQLHHHMVKDDEDRYRCFVFEEKSGGSFNLAQSGDATCNGLLSPTEGSRTLQLKKVESHHNNGGRVCRFPAWLTTHHLWHTLDYSDSYHFSPRNGTLRVTAQQQHTAQRVRLRAQCHHLVQATDTQALLVAHLTTGCQSGYSCMMFYKRESHVIELQQSANRTQTPEEACSSFNFNPLTLPYTTLTTSTPRTRKCPYLGRYEVSLNETLYSGPPGLSLLLANPSLALTNRNAAPGAGSAPETPLLPDNCKLRQTQTLTVGCSQTQDKMEFHTRVYCAGSAPSGQANNNRWYSTSDGSEEEQAPAIDTLTAYSCHGDWTDHNGTTRYLIVLPSSRKSVGARRYCFVMQDGGQGGPEGSVHVSSLTESCYRHHQQQHTPQGAAAPSSSSAHAHLYNNNNNNNGGGQEQRGGGGGGAGGEMMMSFNITPLGECSSAPPLTSLSLFLLMSCIVVSLR